MCLRGADDDAERPWAHDALIAGMITSARATPTLKVTQASRREVERANGKNQAA
jgi:hypothetical protein